MMVVIVFLKLLELVPPGTKRRTDVESLWLYWRLLGRCPQLSRRHVATWFSGPLFRAMFPIHMRNNL